MKKIEAFIINNYKEFCGLEDSEVSEYSVMDFDDEIIGYLFKNYRYDFKGICVYLVKERDEIWVENMES
jgi:hypothetical protein